MTFAILPSVDSSLRASPMSECFALPLPSSSAESFMSILSNQELGVGEGVQSDNVNVDVDLTALIAQFMSTSTSMLISLPPAPDLFVTLSTIALVTASDMVPFVPCQPLAIALGSQLGLWAFPICVIGQCLAGVLAFQAARSAADSERAGVVLDSLGEDGKRKFEEFRKLGLEEGNGKVFLALIGLRLAPFFPFSAGNYLLGGATGVSLRPFIIATVFGCLLSNFLSIGIGIGGAELWQQQQM